MPSTFTTLHNLAIYLYNKIQMILHQGKALWEQNEGDISLLTFPLKNEQNYNAPV